MKYKSLDIAKYAALIRVFLYIPIFIVSVILERYKNSEFYSYFVIILSLISFLLSLPILLGYLKFSKDKKVNLLYYTLIIAVVLITFDLSSTLLQTLNILISELLQNLHFIFSVVIGIIVGLYLTKISKYYKITKSIGNLIIVSNLLVLIIKPIPFIKNPVVGMVFVVGLLSYVILQTIISAFEYKLFSELGKNLK